MKITIPYNPRTPFLEAIHQNNKRFKVVVAHRRSGKSVAAINELIKQAAITKNARFAYICPTYKQAKDIAWDYLKYYSAPIPHVKVNESELRIDLPNGSRIKLYGADMPDALRGIGLWGVVFDEYAQIKENVFTEIIMPALADHGGFAIFIGTPKGKNHFWKLFVRAKQDEHWNGALFKSSETKILSDDELELQRRTIPADFYQQEYECSFLENAGAFFKRITHNIEQYLPRGECQDFQIGVDLAKYRDWTVITPFCLNHFHSHPQERFNQIDYNLQKSRIEAAYLRNNRGKVVIDSTGVGEPVYDDLRLRGIMIEPFQFTTISRELLLRNLSLLLEQDKIKIPNDEGLIDELSSFQYELGLAGKVKISVPDNMTDDRVMSLALSVWKALRIDPTDETMPFMQYNSFGEPIYR